MKIYAIGAIVLAVIGFLTYLLTSRAALERELSECKIAYEKLAQALEIQNAAIEKQKLDLQTYENTKGELESKIETRYNVEIVKDSSCEQQLKQINDSLQIFYKGAK